MRYQYKREQQRPDQLRVGDVANFSEFTPPELLETQDGPTLGSGGEIPFGAETLPIRRLGGSALEAVSGRTGEPFGIPVMVPVDSYEGNKLGRKITGSLPTNRLTDVPNPHTKGTSRLSDGSDVTGDD